MRGGGKHWIQGYGEYAEFHSDIALPVGIQGIEKVGNAVFSCSIRKYVFTQEITLVCQLAVRIKSCRSSLCTPITHPLLLGDLPHQLHMKTIYIVAHFSIFEGTHTEKHTCYTIVRDIFDGWSAVNDVTTPRDSDNLR